MAETLTYDPATDTATVGDNLTPDEQENLEVGEKLEAEQEGLLAGKYKNAEELEKAYTELEKKLGGEEPTEETVDEVEETESSDEPDIGSELITRASKEYEENGKLSDETLATFSEMSSRELVEAYVSMQASAPAAQPSVDLTESQVNVIQNSVGGEKAYNEITGWAAQNLEPSYVEAFDNLVGTGDAKVIELAIAGMKAQYENANGYEGRMLSGKSPQTSGDVYRSQAELVEAMSDRRYDNDPAYRQDVIAKLERSDNLQF